MRRSEGQLEFWARSILDKLGDRGSFLIPLVVYRLVLDLTYQYGVSVRYAYLGSTYAFDVSWIVQSWIVMILAYFAVGKKRDLASLIMSLLYIIILVPACSFYATSDHAKNAYSFVSLCIAAGCFSLTCLFVRFMPPIVLPQVKGKGKLLNFVLPAVMIATIAALFVECGGIHLSAVDIFNVYGIRETLSISGVLGYFHVWCYRVIGPYLMIKAFFNRKYGLLAFWVLVQFCIYLITPFKEIIFIPIMMLICFWLCRKDSFARSFCWLLTALCVLALSMSVGLDDYRLLSLMPDRILNGPAQIMFEFFDFFSQEEFVYYSDSSLAFLFGMQYPYGDQSVGAVIAMEYMGVVSNSNTGYLSAAFANGGYIAMVAESLVLGVVVQVLGGLADDASKEPIFCLLLAPCFALANGSLSTCLLSGGILLVIVLVCMGGMAAFSEEKRQACQGVLQESRIKKSFVRQ